MILLPYSIPTGCDDCPICAFDGEYLFYYCPLSNDDVTPFKGERHPDCPIINKEIKRSEMKCSNCIHLYVCKYPDDDGCKMFMKGR